MTDPIILIGGGGHCKACIDVIEGTRMPIAGIIDKGSWGTILGYTILGDDNIVDHYVDGHRFLIAIGQIKSAELRVKLFQQIKNLGGKFITIISPSAQVSHHAKVEEGTIVMQQAIVNACAFVGENCIINNKALIEHDAIVNEHTHISTAAIINGGCSIGKRNFIGSNSVLTQGVKTADDVIIGAGSVVLKNILGAGIYAGNPAKRISQ